VRTIRTRDWANSWKRHFKPLDIAGRLLVRPSWSRRRPGPGQVEVVLDPGLSFGTGQHPTTAFCLEQVVRHRPGREPRALLDVGTGSGILAIAAAKLGYAPVEAFDFDPTAVRAAAENVARNGVADRVRLRRRDLTRLPRTSREQFDVVCANLLADLLVRERGRLAARVKPGGILVLAGILAREFPAVRAAYEELGFKKLAGRHINEWESAAFRLLTTTPTTGNHV
jgi:ribosomal protein L11 methyltransferase